MAWEHADASRHGYPASPACGPIVAVFKSGRTFDVKEASMIGYVTIGTNDLPRAAAF